MYRGEDNVYLYYYVSRFVNVLSFRFLYFLVLLHMTDVPATVHLCGGIVKVPSNHAWWWATYRNDSVWFLYNPNTARYFLDCEPEKDMSTSKPNTVSSLNTSIHISDSLWCRLRFAQTSCFLLRSSHWMIARRWVPLTLAQYCSRSTNCRICYTEFVLNVF